MQAREAVHQVVVEAQSAVELARVCERLRRLAGEDFPALATVLDLVAERFGADDRAQAAVAALRVSLVRVWDEVEALAGERP